MATITIPPGEFPTLARIVEFSDLDFDALVNALKVTEPSLSRNEYAERLSNVLSGLTKKHASDILRTIFAIHQIRDRSNFDSKALAEAIGLAVSESKQHGDLFTGGKMDVLKSRLLALMNLEGGFVAVMKAMDLLQETDHVYCDARILSDIRPIFGSSLDAPEGAVIMHNMQISYHHLGKHDEFYVMLDDRELQDLKDIIDRAQKKSIALKSLAEKVGLRIF